MTARPTLPSGQAARSSGRVRCPALEDHDDLDDVPFLVFYGDVSEDSDGPIELCRPVAPRTGEHAVAGMADIQVRVERAHDEAYIRIALRDMSWPALLPACDALGHRVAA